MPMSRARTAICSAPLECPSSPGLPTRILSPRPSASPTRSTSSRSASRSAAATPAAASPTPVGARNSPKAPRSVAAHSPVVAPARAAASVAGMALLSPAGGPLDQRRALARLEAIDADEHLLAGLDAADPLAVGLDQRRLHVVDGPHGAAVLGDDVELGPGALDQLRDEPVHDLRALEDVGVLEQIRLVGEHLLDAQRPLLVPGARQAERLVPRRQLDGPRAGVAAERDGEGFQHDPLE